MSFQGTARVDSLRIPEVSLRNLAGPEPLGVGWRISLVPSTENSAYSRSPGALCIPNIPITPNIPRIAFPLAGDRPV